MSGFIPYGRQDITQADLDAVREVLVSDFLTQGPAVPRFEAEVAAQVGAARGIAVNSATSALHVAALALGLGPGTRLWTQPITFVASANIGPLCGAETDFVDIDPQTLAMSPAALEEKLERARREDRLPQIIMPVHMCGHPADMAAIGELARHYGVRVIEDASHAIGASRDGAMVGACAHSDVAVFSFHPVKIVTTAEGGMAMTQDAALAGRMELHRSHGVTRDEALMRGGSEGGWYYQQVDLGLNYRMTEMQAALGLSQMQRLDEYVTRRNALADRYDRLLSDMPLTLPSRPGNGRSAFHLYAVQMASEKRRAVFDAMRAAEIGVNVHYIPVHLQPFWRDRGFGPGDFPASEAYYAGAMSIPLFPTMTEAQQDRVADVLADALK